MILNIDLMSVIHAISRATCEVIGSDDRYEDIRAQYNSF
jgi:hypothetical protein